MSESTKSILIEKIPLDLYFKWVELKARKQAKSWVELIQKIVDEEGV